MIRNTTCAILLALSAFAAHAQDRTDTGENMPSIQVKPGPRSPFPDAPAQSYPAQSYPENPGKPGNGIAPLSPGGNGGLSYSGNPNCPDCPKPRPHYDTQEVIHNTQDVDQSRVINTISVVPVAPRTKETNHLIIRKNTIRNVGVVQHNHTIIEKEIRYKRPAQRSKVVGYIMQDYQTVYKPAIVYVPYTYPVRYAVPSYPKHYYQPQHHHQPSCCQQVQYQQHYPQPYYQQHYYQPEYRRTGLLQWSEY